MPELVTEEQQETLDLLSTYPHPFYAAHFRPDEQSGEYPAALELTDPPAPTVPVAERPSNADFLADLLASVGTPSPEPPSQPAATVWSSLITHGPPGMHSVMVDIDHPAAVIETSTPGHHHLYIDVAVPWEKYLNLLEAMADCGLVEPGYVEASRARGATFLRLPWITKENTT